MCLKLCDGSLSKYLYEYYLSGFWFLCYEKCFVGPNLIKELGTGGEKGKGKREKGKGGNASVCDQVQGIIQLL